MKVKYFLILLIVFYSPLSFGQCSGVFILNTTNETCPGFSDGTASIDVQGTLNTGDTVSLLSYCQSNPSEDFFLQFQSATSIGQVQLAGDNSNIINNTLGSVDFYEDYTALMYADVTEGQLYTVFVQPHDEFPNNTPGNYNYAPEAINVYIDFNIDGDFLDPGEDLGVIYIPWGTWVPGTIYPFTFSVPSTGVFGATRMRVVCMSNAGQASISMGSCESPLGWNTPWFGATEDYSVVLNTNSSYTFLWSNGLISDSVSGLSPGSYTVSITDQNGCVESDVFTVSPSASVLSVSAGLDQTICHGGNPLQLSANSSSAINYSWFPSASFIDPALQSPIFSSSFNTTTVFTVSATDSYGCTVHDSVIVNVNPVPSVTLSPSLGTACLNDNIQLTAITSIPVNLFRFQYNIGNGWQNIITTNNGGWGALNPQFFNNISILTQFRVRVRELWGCTVSPWSPVVNIPVSLVNTPLISHN